jgi:hypothetical protein
MILKKTIKVEIKNYKGMDGDLSVCLYAENKIYVCTVQPQSGVVYF